MKRDDEIKTIFKLVLSIVVILTLISGCSTMEEQDDSSANVGTFEDVENDTQEDEFAEDSTDGNDDQEKDVAESDSDSKDSQASQETESDGDLAEESDELDSEDSQASQETESDGDLAEESDEFDSEENVVQKKDDKSETVASNSNEYEEFSEPEFQEPPVAQSEQQALPPVTQNQPPVEDKPPVLEEPAISPEPQSQGSVPNTSTAEVPTEAPPELAIPEPEVSTNQYSDNTADSGVTGKKVKITDMQYRINDQGGTFIIQADGAIQFTHRLNPQTNQLVLELTNAVLPKKLQRPFNTKDFPGQIGYIDAYQLKGATAPRIVLQLRNGASEPVIQNEGNALYIISQGGVIPSGQEMSLSANESGGETLGVTQEASGSVSAEETQSSLFASENFEDFLRSNQTFSGKPISIEIDDMELRDIFKLISEEAGVNLVIADDVKGKMSLRLKSVPWDQALVMVMKAKKLGYTRSGNVLRIASMAEIRNEEEDAIRIQVAKRNNQPAVVKTITINYAKVEDLEKQVRPLLSPKGAVVSDARTSSLVITDVVENLERAEKLVKALDIPPQQVLIEGKIVEASDNFERRIGINWAVSGRATNLTSGGSNGPIRFTPGLSVTPGAPAASTMGLNFALGTLDVLGDLTASLRIFELQGLVKVISSPRILTLHNETAQIGQTTEIPLITSNIQPNGATTPVVNFKPVQLKLSVTPQVTNDGSIILGVDMTREVPGEVVDAQTNARPVNSRSAKTKVLLKNSQTAVIGGIYQNDTTESESRVPGIAKVPVIGWLFKNKSIDRKRTELLIFLTPRILGQMQSLPTAGSAPSIPSNAPADTALDFEKDDTSDLNENDGFSDSLEDDNMESDSLDEEFDE